MSHQGHSSGKMGQNHGILVPKGLEKPSQAINPNHRKATPEGGLESPPLEESKEFLEFHPGLGWAQLGLVTLEFFPSLSDPRISGMLQEHSQMLESLQFLPLFYGINSGIAAPREAELGLDRAHSSPLFNGFSSFSLSFVFPSPCYSQEILLEFAASWKPFPGLVFPPLPSWNFWEF